MKRTVLVVIMTAAVIDAGNELFTDTSYEMGIKEFGDYRLLHWACMLCRNRFYVIPRVN
jgi:hypothetical protein